VLGVHLAAVFGGLPMSNKLLYLQEDQLSGTVYRKRGNARGGGRLVEAVEFRARLSSEGYIFKKNQPSTPWEKTSKVKVEKKHKRMYVARKKKPMTGSN